MRPSIEDADDRATGEKSEPFSSAMIRRFAKELRAEEQRHQLHAQIDAKEIAWDPVIQEALMTKALTAANRPMPAVSERCWSLPKLRAIALNGIGLQKINCQFTPALHSGVRTLSLCSNRLQAIPRCVGELVGLEELSLTMNRIEELPDIFGSFPRLHQLHLAGNRLKRVPPSVGRLRLTRLDVSNNRLVSLPESMAVMPLEVLILNNNLMVSLPNWLPRLAKLRKLSATQNLIEAFPPWLIRCQNLEHLNLSGNCLLGLPDEVGDMPACRDLILEWNQIETLPLRIAEASSRLRVLRMEGNPLQFPPMSFLRTHGPAGLSDWATGVKQQSSAENDTLVSNHFYRVLELIAERGLASPGLLCPEVWMAFDGRTSQYYCIDWEPFFDQVWSSARAHFSRQLPLKFGGDDDPKPEQAARLASAGRSGEAKRYDSGKGRAHAEAPEGPQPASGAGSDIGHPTGTKQRHKGRRKRPQQDFWELSGDSILQALAVKSDATGPMLRKGVQGLFKSCLCTSLGAKSRACVPPRPEYRCMRRCVALKAKAEKRTALQQEQTSKQAKAAVQAAAKGAQLNAEVYCDSAEGKEMLLERARRAAEHEEQHRERDAYAAAVDQNFKQRKEDATVAHEAEMAELHVLREQELRILREQESSLRTKLDGLQGWKADMVRHEIARLEEANAGAVQATVQPSGIKVAWGDSAPPGQATGPQASSSLEDLTSVPATIPVAAEDGRILVSAAGRSKQSTDAESGSNQTMAHRPGTADLEHALGSKRPQSTDAAARAAQAVRLGTSHHVAQRVRNLKKQLHGMSNEELKATQKELDEVLAQMRTGGYARRIEDAKAAHKERLAEIDGDALRLKRQYQPETGVFRSLRRFFFGDYRALLRMHYALQREAYIAKRRKQAKQLAIERFDKIKVVADGWRRAGVQRVFDAWRGVVKQSKGAASIQGLGGRKAAAARMGTETAGKLIGDLGRAASFGDPGLASVIDATGKATGALRPPIPRRTREQAARDNEGAERALREVQLSKWEAVTDPLSLRTCYVHVDTGEQRDERPTLDSVDVTAAAGRSGYATRGLTGGHGR